MNLILVKAMPTDLRAETTWFHVFRHMIESGDAAQMGGSAFLIYCTLKSSVDWRSGISSLSLKLICKKTNLSKSQALRHLKKLQDMGYIIITKEGRENKYILKEKICINDKHGTPKAVAIWQYIPSMVEQSRSKIKEIIASGELFNSNSININQFTVNIIIQMINLNNEKIIKIDPDKYHPSIRDHVTRIEEAKKRAATDQQIGVTHDTCRQ